MGDATQVLLGESTHGTREFYVWRAHISRRLIREKDFSLIVVEGDWAPLYQVNLYVRGLAHQEKSARKLLVRVMTRWPRWMWANVEFAEFVEWLRDHNRDLPAEKRTGLYGMDLYDLEGSLKKVQVYLERVDPQRAKEAGRFYAGLLAHEGDGRRYMRYLASGGEDQRFQVEAMIQWLHAHRERYVKVSGSKDFFNALQNAKAVREAESHFRATWRRDGSSWDVRAVHFADTVERLLGFHGGKKVIIWAHNTHIGDARATTMKDSGRTNIGEVMRTRHGRKVYSVGFGTFRGSVLAGSSWGAPVQVMTVPDGMPGSLEEILSRALSGQDGYHLLGGLRTHPFFSTPVGHRAIGVTYHPGSERPGNYVPTRLGQRYDAFVFVHETNALTAL